MPIAFHMQELTPISVSRTNDYRLKTALAKMSDHNVCSKDHFFQRSYLEFLLGTQ